jgi:hypothetical protein
MFAVWSADRLAEQNVPVPSPDELDPVDTAIGGSSGKPLKDELIDNL